MIYTAPHTSVVPPTAPTLATAPAQAHIPEALPPQPMYTNTTVPNPLSPQTGPIFPTDTGVVHSTATAYSSHPTTMPTDPTMAAYQVQNPSAVSMPSPFVTNNIPQAIGLQGK